MKLRLLVAAAIAACALAGCATTSISGYTDPSYHGFKAKSIVVFAKGFNYDIQQRIEKGVCDELVQEVRCFPAHAVFPATRKFSQEDIFADLVNNNIDVGVIVSYGDEGHNRSVLGYTSTGRATTNYYSFSNQAFTTYSGTTSPIISNTRQMSAGVAFVRVDPQETIYVGEMSTFGSDFSISNTSFANAMVKKLSQEIRTRMVGE